MGKKNKKKRRVVPAPKAVPKTQPLPTLSALSPFEIATTIQTLQKIISEPEIYYEKALKPLRRSLFQLRDSGIIISETPKNKSLSADISEALQNGFWEKSLFCLKEMRQHNYLPKLGALQRWVRFCDAAGVDDNEALVVLDAILRTANPEMVSPEMEGGELLGNVRMFPQWEAFPLGGFELPVLDEEEVQKWRSKSQVVYQLTGEMRNPENKYDLVIHTIDPGLMHFEDDRVIDRIDVPNVPGCFMMKNVLSYDECRQILLASEAIGFLPDEPLEGSRSILAHNVVWLVDEMINNVLYRRCLPHFPPSYNGGDVCGLNRRWRIYRYVPGAVYRPHIDGAWPASGLDENGEYMYDAKGDSWSRLTFLLYLNEGFEGGSTTYYTPSSQEGILNGFPVAPRAGSVLIFPHGNTEGSLLHEGSGVLEGTKYIVRTEVLYKTDHIYRGKQLEKTDPDYKSPKKRKRSKREGWAVQKNE